VVVGPLGEIQAQYVSNTGHTVTTGAAISTGLQMHQQQVYRNKFWIVMLRYAASVNNSMKCTNITIIMSMYVFWVVAPCGR
jgi:hypothetical protein